jgi:plasmid stabilization system protein ParE
MKLRYTPRALFDIEKERAYLLTRSPQGAQNVLAELHRALDYIAHNTKGSVETDIKNVHTKTVTRYHYRIFYEAADETIDFIHIRHTSRRSWRA